ncbi:UNVERIFIED_ORG: hypothetical protein ABID33_003864 [Xanthobacter viscosus]|uniref:DUF4276 family protein n=1 Tax=Xanthobacter autotrophicus TaxID=280 RepID=A0A6C1KMP9_XANAU|nr:hypothetical protein [Xanthobacter autotrophicus]TLX44474.1 hypothetical protein FBQ73_02540 [Xanthobacter autotrophicus]
MINIGLVAEGTHDFIMLKPFITHEVSSRFGKRVQFRQLQPAPDSTGNMTSGGWARVVGWCQSNSGPRLDTFFTPLFSNDAPCDIIILHLDGDALEVASQHHSFTVPSAILDAKQRVSILTSILEHFLSPTTEQRGKIAMALPVQHTESWVLSAENLPGDPETIDAKKELRKVFPKPHRRLSDHYQKRVSGLNGAIPKETCVSYRCFVDEISNIRI